MNVNGAIKYAGRAFYLALTSALCGLSGAIGYNIAVLENQDRIISVIRENTRDIAVIESKIKDLEGIVNRTYYKLGAPNK